MPAFATTGFDAVTTLNRLLLLDAQVSLDNLTIAAARFLPRWQVETVSDTEISVTIRDHVVSVRIATIDSESVLAHLPSPARHDVKQVLVVTANDLESESAGWLLGRSLAQLGETTWCDGERMINVPAGAEASDETVPNYPSELWMPFAITLATAKPLSIDDLAAASVATNVETEEFRLEWRLASRDETAEKADAEQLAGLDARLGTPARGFVDITSYGSQGYVAAVELATRLSLHVPVAWLDQTGNWATFDSGLSTFEAQAPTPNAVLYLDKAIDEWDMAEMLVPLGADRVPDAYGRARWLLATDEGAIGITLERDGVIEQLSRAGKLGWLDLFGGQAGGLVLFDSEHAAAMELANALAQLISTKARGYWLPTVGQHGWLGF